MPKSELKRLKDKCWNLCSQYIRLSHANKDGYVTCYTSYLPYKKPEEDLKQAGFDVLVFVPSFDEENGLVTCGNAILGGSKLKLDSDVIKIHGYR